MEKKLLSAFAVAAIVLACGCAAPPENGAEGGGPGGIPPADDGFSPTPAECGAKLEECKGAKTIECGQWMQACNWGEGPPREEGAPQPQETDGAVKEIPKAPAGEVGIYKGFWMPSAWFGGRGQAMSSPSALKDAGANIAAIAPTIKINAKGEVSYSGNEGKEERLAGLAGNYYTEEIRIFLSIEPYYEEEFIGGSGGEPQPIPLEIADQEGFLEEYDEIVLEMAELAEKYHVEMFSPMNEPDRKLGAANASRWGQEILPKIRERYSGKVVFKGDLSAGQGNEVDFSGYDVLGFSITPGDIGHYRDNVKERISGAAVWAKRDNVESVMATEFGVWGDAGRTLTAAEKAEAYRIVLEEGEGKLAGFIAFDPPADQGWSLEGSEALETVKEWFTGKSR